MDDPFESISSESHEALRHFQAERHHKENVALLKGEIDTLRQRMDAVANRKEWHSCGFWLAIIGILLGAFALLRDATDWRLKSPPASVPELPAKSPSATPREESK